MASTIFDFTQLFSNQGVGSQQSPWMNAGQQYGDQFAQPMPQMDFGGPDTTGQNLSMLQRTQREEERNGLLPVLGPDGVPMDDPSVLPPMGALPNAVPGGQPWPPNQPSFAGLSQNMGGQMPPVGLWDQAVGNQSQQNGWDISSTYSPNMLLRLAEGYNRGGLVGALGLAMTDLQTAGAPRAQVVNEQYI